MATGRVPTTANSPLTAKGDLFGYSTTQARVPVGNDGETLVADSSTSTGLRYIPSPTVVQPVINGGYDIWQRGTSFSIAAGTPNVYTADRWNTTTNANQAVTVSRQTTADTTNLPFIQYCARYQRNAGQTGTAELFFVQSFETATAIPYVGKTITVSFYARAGANYSAASNILRSYVATGTGTDQNLLATYTGFSSQNQSHTLTTSWQRFTQTVSITSSATEFGVYFGFTPVGTAGANDYYEVTGVQVDVGNVALPFRRAGGTLAGELAACQRYYYLHVYGISQAISLGTMYTNNQLIGVVNFPMTMRVNPTLIATSAADYYAFYRLGTADYFNSLTLGDVNVNCANIYNTTEISGTAGDSGIILTPNSNARIAFSAEL